VSPNTTPTTRGRSSPICCGGLGPVKRSSSHTPGTRSRNWCRIAGRSRHVPGSCGWPWS